MKTLVCIDVQNDFINGVLGVDKDLTITDRIINYARKVKSEGGVVLATKDTHYNANYMDTLEGQWLPVPHCIAMTVGWEIPDALKDVVEGNIIEKPTFGSFSLPEFVREHVRTDNDEIEVCGFCSSICVISNLLILRAAFPNTKISMLVNLCGDVNESNHKAACEVANACQIDLKTI